MIKECIKGEYIVFDYESFDVFARNSQILVVIYAIGVRANYQKIANFLRIS